MSPAVELLAEIQRVGGNVWPKPDGLLGYRLPPNSADLIDRLRVLKPEILALLAGPPAPCASCFGGDFWRTHWGAWLCCTCHPDPERETQYAHAVRRVRGWVPFSGDKKPGTQCRTCGAISWQGSAGNVRCDCERVKQ